VSDVIRPGAGVLFMKVGTHAQESLADIIARKTREIEETGYAMWGYGGNTCHPRTMVQPFAESFAARHAPIYLCMHEMDSRHFAEQLRANEFSVDGAKWEPIPDTINVMGSRFALVLEDLRQEELVLPLAKAKVAIGLSKGRPAGRYIQGQADKACLEVLGAPLPDLKPDESGEIRIGLVARLKPPYAVFLRDHRRKVVPLDEGEPHAAPQVPDVARQAFQD
jgi:hypothetical protein